MRYPSFIYGSNENQAVTADQQRTVNFYPEIITAPGANSRAVLLPTPGVEEISEHSSGPGRAHLFLDGREFAVIGGDFVEIDSVGTITDRGDVTIDGNPATISSNGDGGGQLFVTSGTNGYYYNLSTNVLTSIAALAGKATMGGLLDGYFIALDSATSTVYASALNDGATWSTGTSFAQRSSAPDPWVAIKVNGQYIWKFGQHTSEVWYDNAGTPYPFTKHPSGSVQYGIGAAFSAAVAPNGSLFWLGATSAGAGFVCHASGFNVEIVSTPAIQNTIESFATISDAQGEVIHYLGHTFYRLHFPSADTTLVYDQATNQWFEWSTWIAEDNEYVAQRARFVVHAFGEHRALDSDGGSVYRIGRDLREDVDERPIRRLRRAPALLDENRRVFYNDFELFLEPGLGLATGQGFDPQVMLRISNDGGKTWSNERMASAGKIGEYGRRCLWTRCGSGRNRVFEVSVSDPIAWKLVDAYLNPDPIRTGRRVA